MASGSTKGVADVLFCIDASNSMAPCIEGVKANVSGFIDGLSGNPNYAGWDLRMDYVAHSALERTTGVVFKDVNWSLCHESTNFPFGCQPDVIDSLYLPQVGQQKLFTSSVEEFRTALDKVQPKGNEASLVALDCCLDFPWRGAAKCHRVVIFLTDQPLEDGALLEAQTEMLDALIEKIQALKVMLFIIAPESDAYDMLAEADKSEYQVVGEGNGLAGINFHEVLEGIGKSVSVSIPTLQGMPQAPVEKGLFKQATWTISTGGDYNLEDS